MAKAQRADHEIHAHYKLRMKRAVVAALVVAFMLYTVILLPATVMAPLQNMVGVWGVVISRVLGGAALGPLLAIVFFSSDSAFNGESKTAIWTRSIQPSQVCARKHDFTLNQATALWFRYFDTWALPGSPNQALLQNTYSATYTARMVFHLSRTCLILLILSVLTIVATIMPVSSWTEAYDRSKAMAPQFTVVGLYLAVGLWLVVNNRSGRSGKQPTGAWMRLDQVFGRSVVLFEREVLNGNPSFDDAMLRVEAIRRSCDPASPKDESK